MRWRDSGDESITEFRTVVALFRMFQSTKTFDLDFLCPSATLSQCTVALFESQWGSLDLDQHHYSHFLPTLDTYVYTKPR